MQPEYVTEVTSTNWSEIVLKSRLPVVVEFYTPACPYCKVLTPIFHRLSPEYMGRMVFVKIDASANGEIARGYGVMGVPTLRFFCAGRPIYEIVGLRSEQELREEFDKVLGIHKNCVTQSSPIYA
ncbi:thioredoxin [Candidatus Bathyarchaeota archaeon]|nr:thioredoxin [Candidatus Bathyarchaeota archaeon]